MTPNGQKECQTDFILSEPEELIGIRDFAALVHVSHVSIIKAIDRGRIVAVVRTKRGRKLKKAQALKDWKQVHYSEDDIEEEAAIPRPSWFEFHIDPDDRERGLDENIGEADQELELLLRNIVYLTIIATDYESPVPDLMDKVTNLAVVTSAAHDSLLDSYYGTEEEEAARYAQENKL